MEDNFPGNSHASKILKEAKPETPKVDSEKVADPPAEKKVEQVVQAKVRRKPIGTRLREMFANDDEQSFADYLVNNVAVPMIKDMIINMVAQTLDGIKNGVEDRIAGGPQNRTTRTVSHGTGTPRVNYNLMSSNGTARRSSVTRPPGPAPRIAVRRSNVVQDIILGTRDECDMVIEELGAVIDGMGHCTVGDLYTIVGEKANHVDERWGWTDLEGARGRLIPSTGEFLLVMPQPIPIEYQN